MSSKFVVNFQSDSDQQTPKNTQSPNHSRTQSQTFLSSQSAILSLQKSQPDKYTSKISKNDFFAIEQYQTRQEVPLNKNKSQLVEHSVITNQSNINKRNQLRRKKVSTTIKLQPLREIQKKDQEFKKTTQTVQIYKTVSQSLTHQKQTLNKSPLLSKNPSENQGLGSIYKEKLLNFQIQSSDQSDSQNEQQLAKSKQMNDLNKINFKKSGSNKQKPFFFDEEQQPNTKDKLIEDIQNKSNEKPKIKRKVSGKLINQSNQNQAEKQKAKDNEQNSSSEQKQAKINFSNQPNPQKQLIDQKSKNLDHSGMQQSIAKSRQKYISQLEQKKMIANKIRNFLITPLQVNSVLNLKIKRDASLLNFFSPQFRIEFSQDAYFVMACKKTSSKPTSTFTFTAENGKFQQTSSHYMGKMKSNLVGNVLNIFAPGHNPTTAMQLNLAPRQLLATIVYKTQLFGSGKPREFSVYMKKPEFKYYQDFKGTKIYDEQIPLNELYYAFQQNMDKIKILTSRKPVFHNQSREFVMNFDGKVKKSSVKNFILQDTENQNAKCLLFGKNQSDEYALDIYAPFSPLVGVAIAMSSFDSRIGSD